MRSSAPAGRGFSRHKEIYRLADNYQAKRILQVAYFRPTKWASLQIDGKGNPLPGEVIQHFRDVGNISQMKTQVLIQVLRDEFKNRVDYGKLVRQAIANSKNSRCIIFLDPDTGLQPPSGKANPTHVLNRELEEIWGLMKDHDVLVLDQHRNNMAGRPWREPKLRQFEQAAGLKEGTARLAHGPDIASDVAFIYAQK